MRIRFNLYGWASMIALAYLRGTLMDIVFVSPTDQILGILGGTIIGLCFVQTGLLGGVFKS